MQQEGGKWRWGGLKGDRAAVNRGRRGGKRRQMGS